jgi:hypothetical protein
LEILCLRKRVDAKRHSPKKTKRSVRSERFAHFTFSTYCWAEPVSLLMIAVVVSIMVPIVVVIVIVPIAVSVPTPTFHVPPLMGVFPAVMASLAQFLASTFSLLALIPVAPDRFMQAMVGLYDSFLTLIVGLRSWRSCKERQSRGQCGRSKCDFPVS